MSLELEGISNGVLLKCRVCRNTPLSPLILDCLHQVCKSCADNAGGSITCPDCSVATDCSTAPDDLLSSGLIQRSLACQNWHCCGPCSDDERPGKIVVSWCYDCQLSLCSDCDSEHHRQNRSHARHEVEKLGSLHKLYRLPSRTCADDNKELSLACFTCFKAKCSVCAHACYMSSHFVVPFENPDFVKQLGECKSNISELVTSLSSSTERLDLLVTLPEKIAEDEENALRMLDNAKRAAVDSLSRAYDRSRHSLRDCYDSVKSKAQRISQDSQVIKARIQSAKERWDIALKADDVLGLFTQLNLLKSSVQELQEKVVQAVDPVDTSQLVNSGICLPDDLDQITSTWLGLAKVLNEDFGSSESAKPTYADSETNSKEAINRLPIFGAASDTFKMSSLCIDVSVTDDGRLLFADCQGHLVECIASGKELSRWRPPKRKDGAIGQVVSVESLMDRRAAVGVTLDKIIVLLKRVYGATGEEAWIEDRRLKALQITPFSLGSHGDVLVVADMNNSHAEVIGLSDRQQHSTKERLYYIQSVAITDKLIITVSFSNLESSSGKRPHVVDAHTLGGDDDRLLWRYDLPDGEQAKDVCADATGQVVYIAVGKTYSHSGRVTAVSTLNGQVLRSDVVIFNGPLSPYKLALCNATRQALLVVLAYDSSTGEWGKTVTVYRGALVGTDPNSVKMKRVTV